MTVLIRSKHLTRDWGPALAYAVSKACLAGDHYVADLVKKNEVFPPEWSRLQRRERVFRTFHENPVQVDGNVFELVKVAPDANGRTQILVVRAGKLLPPFTDYEFTPPAKAWPLAQPARTEKCERCRWWNATWHFETGDFGECRVRAPNWNSVNSFECHNRGQWPSTKSSDWCAQFEEHQE